MGTWSLPQTLQQAEKLRSLLQQPIPAAKAPDLLYELYGDDDLFDAIEHVREKDGDSDDIRTIVKYFLARELVNSDRAVNPWDSEAHSLLLEECEEFISLV